MAFTGVMIRRLASCAEGFTEPAPNRLRPTNPRTGQFAQESTTSPLPRNATGYLRSQQEPRYVRWSVFWPVLSL